LTFVCPATEGKGAAIYGTDIYTEGSPVCAAALHAGVLKAGASGTVSIVIGEGADAFRGSERNGVTTRSYGPWRYSYAFVQDDAPATIEWSTVWNQVPADFTQPVTVVCPAGGKTDRLVWGTDAYITDSSICLAAVHAGVIRMETGGAVTVARARALSEYPGTERNGIVSRRWGAWADAFTVKGASVTVANAPPPPPPPPASGATDPTEAPPPLPPPAGTADPRTIQLAGLTLSGISPGVSVQGVAPRTVQLTGLALLGVTPSLPPPAVAPRTITLGGITLAGITR
jgi:hypothetical protein